MNKVTFIGTLSKTAPDISFLQMQNQANQTMSVDVNNICFVSGKYFVTIWNFVGKKARLEVCEIQDNQALDLQALTKEIQKKCTPPTGQKATPNQKIAFLNYFTAMLCFIMPYTKHLFGIDIIDYKIDTSNLSITDNDLTYLLNCIESAYRGI